MSKRNELLSKCTHENKYYFQDNKSVPSYLVTKLDDFLFKVTDIFTTPFNLEKKLSNQLDSMLVPSYLLYLLMLFFVENVLKL